MRVGTRLLLAVAPAVVGIGAVAALAYWGQYARQAPEIVIVVAVVASVASLALAWQNTRYVARRVERIAARTAEAKRAGRDELDEIERSVHGLEDAVREAHAGSASREAASARRAAEAGARLDDVVGGMADGVQAVQLPLHILLDSPFGSLNENQEEMLEAARGAAEALDVRLRQARKLIDLERGAIAVHAKPVGLSELLRPALAIAEARAAKRGVTLVAVVSPAAPRTIVDPVHAQDAVTIVLGEAVERTPEGGELRAGTEEGENGTVRLRVIGAVPDERPSIAWRLADALIRAQGGTLRADQAGTIIELPAEQVKRTRA